MLIQTLFVDKLKEKPTNKQTWISLEDIVSLSVLIKVLKSAVIGLQTCDSKGCRINCIYLIPCSEPSCPVDGGINTPKEKTLKGVFI